MDGVNPKDLIGVNKINFFLLPPVALAHASHAMMDGAAKYGPYNWRTKPVLASVYIAAADRHIKCWQEKEEKSKDSGVHHLGHAISCLAILLDAQASGNLKDDRHAGCNFSSILDILNSEIGKKK